MRKVFRFRPHRTLPLAGFPIRASVFLVALLGLQSLDDHHTVGLPVHLVLPYNGGKLSYPLCHSGGWTTGSNISVNEAYEPGREQQNDMIDYPSTGSNSLVVGIV